MDLPCVWCLRFCKVSLAVGEGCDKRKKRSPRLVTYCASGSDSELTTWFSILRSMVWRTLDLFVMRTWCCVFDFKMPWSTKNYTVLFCALDDLFSFFFFCGAWVDNGDYHVTEFCASNKMGWEVQGTTFLLGGNIILVNQSIIAVPSSKYTARIKVMSNQIPVHITSSQRGININQYSWRRCLIAVRGLGRSLRLMRIFQPVDVCDECKRSPSPPASKRSRSINNLLSISSKMRKTF